jgi:hypothetical protein
MENESVSIPDANQVKPKRKYERRQPQQIPPQSIAPNPQIMALENGIVPLVNQRLEANQKVRAATSRANQANSELQAAQNELSEIESEISYRMNLIGQLKNGGMPVPSQPYISPGQGQPRYADFGQPPMSAPYSPVIPYPSHPVASGQVGSYPAQNAGLYPDATERSESAVDFMTPELRAQFSGRGR